MEIFEMERTIILNMISIKFSRPQIIHSFTLGISVPYTHKNIER